MSRLYRIALRLASTERGARLLFAAAVLLMLAVVLPVRACVNGIRHASKVARSEQNLHAVQLALERFAVDAEGEYPYHVDELLAAGYLEQLPENPFTRQPMRCVETDNSAAPPPPGNPGDFTYVRRFSTYVPDSIEGYSLILY
jgi:hypothetical protein